MNAIIYLLKYEDIEPKEIYGIEANNNTNKGKIIKEYDKYQVFTFMAGMNEFINFGSAARLNAYFNSIKQDGDYSKLLQCVTGISEAIQLCNMTAFGENVAALKDLFDKKEIKKSCSIIEIFIDRINSEYKDLFNDNSCENQIKWCLSKNFIQQALTLVEAKMPKEIVRAGLLREQNNNSVIINKLKSNEKKSIENCIVETVAKKIYNQSNLKYIKDKILYLNIYIENEIKYFNIFVFDNIENHKNILEYFLYLHYKLKSHRNNANHALNIKRIVNEVDEVTYQIKDYLTLFDLLKETNIKKELKSLDIEKHISDKKLWEDWKTKKKIK